MRMTPLVLIFGGLLVFWASVAAMLFLPLIMMEEKPSEIWRPWTPIEAAGHDLYVRNGCSYCHSMYIRNSDWGHGAVRIAQAGDYYGQQPAFIVMVKTATETVPSANRMCPSRPICVFGKSSNFRTTTCCTPCFSARAMNPFSIALSPKNTGARWFPTCGAWVQRRRSRLPGTDSFRPETARLS